MCLGVASPVALAGCEATELAVAPGDPWPAGLAKPADASEAASLRASGIDSWMSATRSRTGCTSNNSAVSKKPRK